MTKYMPCYVSCNKLGFLHNIPYQVIQSKICVIEYLLKLYVKTSH